MQQNLNRVMSWLFILTLFFALAGKGEAAMTVTQHPQDVAVPVGGSATFSSNATGLTWPTLLWFVQPVGKTTWISANLLHTVIPGQKSSTIVGESTFNLQIANIVPEMNGARIRLSIRETINGVNKLQHSNFARLIVTNPGPLMISTQPQSQTFTSGQKNANINVTVAGTTGTLGYQWQYYAGLASGQQWLNITDSANYSGSQTDTLILQQAMHALLVGDPLIVRCFITDSGGYTIMSNTATITAAVPITITTQPQDKTVTEGGMYSFTVAASGGIGKYTYQWEVATSNTGSFTAISGATNATYTLTNAQTTNSGYRFRCVITSGSLNVTSNEATLTVTSAPPPIIITQPQDKTVTEGGTYSFAVVASGGTGKYAYQWEIAISNTGNFTAISGATNATCYLANAQTTDSGCRFRCVVSSGSLNVTSDEATLTVTKGGSGGGGSSGSSGSSGCDTSGSLFTILVLTVFYVLRRIDALY